MKGNRYFLIVTILFSVAIFFAGCSAEYPGKTDGALKASLTMQTASTGIFLYP